MKARAAAVYRRISALTNTRLSMWTGRLTYTIRTEAGLMVTLNEPHVNTLKRRAIVLVSPESKAGGQQYALKILILLILDSILIV